MQIPGIQVLCMHMHTCVHMCTRTHVRVRTCVYTHVHVFALMYNCTAAIVRKYVPMQRIGVALGLVSMKRNDSTEM